MRLKAFERYQRPERLNPPRSRQGVSMRIFLTGATGVIGRRVVHDLSARGHQVTAVGRTSGQARGFATGWS